ncbi:MAG: hypothetical protein ABEJ06_02650 [Haloarculaceae archaeon]
MASASTKIGLGAVLIVAATVVLFAMGMPGSGIPTSLAGVAAVAMAAGALILGTSKPGTGV